MKLLESIKEARKLGRETLDITALLFVNGGITAL
jgi:hypothetical protein